MLNLMNAPALIFWLSGVLCLVLAALAWIVGMARRAAHLPSAVVSSADAAAPLYPYVFVSDAGLVRELLAREKQYLETPFALDDAARPYIKASYADYNLAGSLSGYCRRAALPHGTRINYPPIELRVMNAQANG